MPTSDERDFHLLPTVIERCRRRRGELKLADSTGAKLNGGETLIRALVLRRILRRHFLAEDERMVGVMLPSTVAGAVTTIPTDTTTTTMPDQAGGVPTWIWILVSVLALTVAVLAGVLVGRRGRGSTGG